MNKEKAAQVKAEVEGFTSIPDALYDVGLSMGAVGLFVIWLTHYQQGETIPVTRAASEADLRNPEFPAALRDLIDSGVMPDKYHVLASRKDREYLGKVGG